MRLIGLGLLLVTSFCLVDATTGAPCNQDQADPQELGRLVEQLQSDDFRVREQAAMALIKAGDRALEVVRPLTRSTNPDLRERAARIIEEIEIRRYRDFHLLANYEAGIGLERPLGIYSNPTASRARIAFSSGMAEIDLEDLSVRFTELPKGTKGISACADPSGRTVVWITGKGDLMLLAPGQSQPKRVAHLRIEWLGDALTVHDRAVLIKERDGRLALAELRTGKIRWSSAAYKDATYLGSGGGIAYFLQGRTLIGIGASDGVKRLRLQLGEEKAVLSVDSRTGNVYFASAKQKVLYEIANGKERRLASLGEMPSPNGVALDPDGGELYVLGHQRLLVFSGDGQEPREKEVALTGRRQRPRLISLGRKRVLIWDEAGAGEALLVDTQTASTWEVSVARGGAVTAIALKKDLSKLYMGYSSGEVRAVELRSGKPSWRTWVTAGKISCLYFMESGPALVLGSGNGSLSTINPDDGTVQARSVDSEGGRGAVTAVVGLKNARTVFVRYNSGAIEERDGTLRITATYKLEEGLEGPGELFATGSGELYAPTRNVRRVNVLVKINPRNKTVDTIGYASGQPVTVLGVSSKRGYIVGRQGSMLVVWDLRSRKELLRRKGGAIVVSRDARAVLTSEPALIRLPEGSVLKPLLLNEIKLGSPPHHWAMVDGELLAASGADGTVIVWGRTPALDPLRRLARQDLAIPGDLVNRYPTLPLLLLQDEWYEGTGKVLDILSIEQTSFNVDPIIVFLARRLAAHRDPNHLSERLLEIARRRASKRVQADLGRLFLSAERDSVRVRCPPLFTGARIEECTLPLKSLLQDQSAAVRKATVVVLKRKKAWKILEPIAEIYDKEPRAVQLAFVDAVVSLNSSKDAVALLERLLQKAAPGSRGPLIRALAQEGSDAAMAILRKLDIRTGEELDFLHAVRRSPREQFRKKVAELTRSSSALIRLEAVECLGALGGEGIAESLKEAAKDRNPAIRIAAIRSLVAVGGTKAIQVIRDAISDEEAAVSLEAIRGARTLNAAGATTELMRVLQRTRDEKVKIAAARALGWLGDVKAFPLLQEQLESLLRDPANVVRDPEYVLSLACASLQLVPKKGYPTLQKVLKNLPGRFLKSDIEWLSQSTLAMSSAMRTKAGSRLQEMRLEVGTRVKTWSDLEKKIRESGWQCRLTVPPEAALPMTSGMYNLGQVLELCAAHRNVVPFVGEKRIRFIPFFDAAKEWLALPAAK